MFSKLKNLKLVKSLKSVPTKLKWIMFSQIQDYKINSKYIDLICGDKPKQINDDNEKLEQIVRETLIKEFSPKIQEMKSYNMLVDAVVHNLKKKQNQETEEEFID